MRKHLLLFFIVSFIFLFSSPVLANVNISETFDDDSNLNSQSSTDVSSGSLSLDTDGLIESEDFNNISDLSENWTQYASDANLLWQINNDQLRFPTNHYNLARILWDEINVQNGEIEVDVTILGGEQMAGVIFRASDGDNYYLVDFSSLYDYVALKKSVDGNITQIDSVGHNLEIATSYNLKVSYNSNNIVVEIDDTEVASFTDGSITAAGKIGFYRQGSGVDFDNLSIVSSNSLLGSARSNTFSQDENINQVTLSNISGTNLIDQTFIFVSNNGGDSWEQINEGESIEFLNLGSDFVYQIYLKRDSSIPEIDEMVFDLSLGDLIDQSLSCNQDLTKLHYSDSANSLLCSDFNPNELEFYASIEAAKPVQQMTSQTIEGTDYLFYADSDNNQLVSYNLDSKTEVWRKDLNGYTESTPHIYDGVVYVGSYDKNLYGFDVVTGEQLWSYLANDTISGGPIVVKNGIIYFSDYGYSGTTTLYAVNLATENLVWSFSVDAITFLSFTVDPDLDAIYVNHQDIAIALKASTGSQIWENDLNQGYITKQAVIAGDKLIIGADRGLMVVNKITGATLLNNPDEFSQAEEGIGATPVYSGTTVYYPTKTDAKMIARNYNTGDLIWSTEISDNVGSFSSPVLTNDGYIYVAYNAGIRVFNSINGSLVWESSQLAWAENIPSIANGYLFFTDPADDGSIYIYKIPQVSDEGGDDDGEDNDSCEDLTPQESPNLFKISNDYQNIVNLYFAPVSGINNYIVYYGPRDNLNLYSFRVRAINTDGVIKTVINHLPINESFGFRVVPINGCAYGPSSETVFVKLGISETIVIDNKLDQEFIEKSVAEIETEVQEVKLNNGEEESFQNRNSDEKNPSSNIKLFKNIRNNLLIPCWARIIKFVKKIFIK